MAADSSLKSSALGVGAARAPATLAIVRKGVESKGFG